MLLQTRDKINEHLILFITINVLISNIITTKNACLNYYLPEISWPTMFLMLFFFLWKTILNITISFYFIKIQTLTNPKRFIIIQIRSCAYVINIKMLLLHIFVIIFVALLLLVHDYINTLLEYGVKLPEPHLHFCNKKVICFLNNGW